MSLYQSYVLNEREIRKAEAVVDSLDPVDWPAMIAALVAKGWSLRQIALALEVSLPTVQGWNKSSIPNYERGRKLLAVCQSAGVAKTFKGEKK